MTEENDLNAKCANLRNGTPCATLYPTTNRAFYAQKNACPACGSPKAQRVDVPPALPFTEQEP